MVIDPLFVVKLNWAWSWVENKAAVDISNGNSFMNFIPELWCARSALLLVPQT
jgi:hypothetical protein